MHFILLFHIIFLFSTEKWVECTFQSSLCTEYNVFANRTAKHQRNSVLRWHAALCSRIHRVTELFSIRNLLLSKVSSSDENGILNPPRMIYPFFFLIFLHIEKIQHFMYMYLLWSHFLWGLQTLLIFSDCLHPLRINPTQNLFGV